MLAEKFEAVVQCEAAACGALCEGATKEQEEACLIEADGSVCASYLDVWNEMPSGAAAQCTDLSASQEDMFRMYASMFCGTGM